MSVLAACKMMSEYATEKFPELADEFSADAIRARYKRQMDWTIRPTVEKPPPEVSEETKAEIIKAAAEEVKQDLIQAMEPSGLSI